MTFLVRCYPHFSLPPLIRSPPLPSIVLICFSPWAFTPGSRYARPRPLSAVQKDSPHQSYHRAPDLNVALHESRGPEGTRCPRQ